jgi:hypothetical protein
MRTGLLTAAKTNMLKKGDNILVYRLSVLNNLIP